MTAVSVTGAALTADLTTARCRYPTNLLQIVVDMEHIKDYARYATVFRQGSGPKRQCITRAMNCLNNGRPNGRTTAYDIDTGRISHETAMATTAISWDVFFHIYRRTFQDKFYLFVDWEYLQFDLNWKPRVIMWEKETFANKLGNPEAFHPEAEQHNNDYPAVKLSATMVIHEAMQGSYGGLAYGNYKLHFRVHVLMGLFSIIWRRPQGWHCDPGEWNYFKNVMQGRRANVDGHTWSISHITHDKRCISKLFAEQLSNNFARNKCCGQVQVYRGGPVFENQRCQCYPRCKSTLRLFDPMDS